MPAIELSAFMLLIVLLAGYMLGSIAGGMILSRIMGLGDLRQIGSGNIGATNVLRTGNKLAAALTLLLDGGKGVVAVLLGRYLGDEAGAQLAGFAAFIGHCYPVWLGFRGGKGVATFLGIWLALAWPVGIACCLSWLATAVIARVSSLSALVASASAPVWAFLLGAPQAAFVGALLAALVFWRHRSNINRLMAGTEPKIGQK